MTGGAPMTAGVPMFAGVPMAAGSLFAGGVPMAPGAPIGAGVPTTGGAPMTAGTPITHQFGSNYGIAPKPKQFLSQSEGWDDFVFGKQITMSDFGYNVHFMAFKTVTLLNAYGSYFPANVLQI